MISRLLLLIFSISGVVIVADAACCQFPAFSFSALTNVAKANFKCSEPITVTCQYIAEDSEAVAVGIAGNVTNEIETKPTVIKKGAKSVSASLVCDKSSGLWKVDKLSNKYSNVGCVAKSSGGGVWLVY